MVSSACELFYDPRCCPVCAITWLYGSSLDMHSPWRGGHHWSLKHQSFCPLKPVCPVLAVLDAVVQSRSSVFLSLYYYYYYYYYYYFVFNTPTLLPFIACESHRYILSCCLSGCRWCICTCEAGRAAQIHIICTFLFSFLFLFLFHPSCAP